MHLIHASRLLAAPLLLLAAAACGGDDDESDSAGTTEAPAEETVSGSITVFAAASLTDAFEEVATAFEGANPGASVELNFGASSALREQILAGAPADVFASANTSNMDQVVEADGVEGEPEVFARNQLQIVVPAGNPGDVDGLDDFADRRPADRAVRRGGAVRAVRARGPRQRRRDPGPGHRRARRA